MSGFIYSTASYNVMRGVDPRLVCLLGAAITIAPFAYRVISGVRTEAEQEALFERGATRTMNSRHLTGHAFDAFIVNSPNGDWHFDDYRILNDHFQAVAHMLQIPLEWGGSWHSIKDGPHWQIPWSAP